MSNLIPPPPPKPPCCALRYDGWVIGFCDKCRSSVRKKYIWFGSIAGCIQPECENYFYKTDKHANFQERVGTIFFLFMAFLFFLVMVLATVGA